MKGDFSRFHERPPKNRTAVLLQQGRVALDSDWNEQQMISRTWRANFAKDLLGLGGAPLSDGGRGFEIEPFGRHSTANFNIHPGAFYVNGQRCVNPSKVSYGEQPFCPGSKLSLNNNTHYLIYLEVRERQITALEDPALLEPALEGVDTTTRIDKIWQVKAQPLPAREVMGLRADPSAWYQERFPKLVFPSNGALKAHIRTGKVRDNRLYRVEIHQSGLFAKAAESGELTESPTFKWSRDNGSVCGRLLKTNTSHQQLIEVELLGRELRHSFTANQFVEITDEARRLNEQPGDFFQIKEVRKNGLELDRALPGWGKKPLIRLWDSDLQYIRHARDEQTLSHDGYLPLEDGIEVKFQENCYYKTGDYWLIPVRVGAREWWRDTLEDATSIFAAPQASFGPSRNIALLALLHYESGLLSSKDLRPKIPCLGAPYTKRDSATNLNSNLETFCEQAFHTENHSAKEVIEALVGAIRDLRKLVSQQSLEIENLREEVQQALERKTDIDQKPSTQSTE